MDSATRLQGLLEQKLKPIFSPDTLAALRVVNRVQDLPWGLYAHMSVTDSEGSPGLYDRADGVVYLVAENLTTPSLLQETLSHELRHLGLARYTRLLGDRLGGDVDTAAHKVAMALDALYVAHQSEIDALAEPGGAYEGIFDRLSPEKRRRLLAEEFFAINRGKYGQDRWFDGVLAALHDFLHAVCRALGISSGVSLGHQSVFRQLEAVVDGALQRPIPCAVGHEAPITDFEPSAAPAQS